MTVFLSLVLAVLLVFITTLIEAARMQTIRFQTEGVMDVGLSGIFAEYHREMLHRYGLLYIDTSYGTNTDDLSMTKEHLLKMMNQNFELSGSGYVFKELTDLHADNTNFQKKCYASDGDGELLKYQIVKYMKQKKGISVAEESLNDGTLYEDKYQDYEQKRHASENKIDSIIEELNSVKDESEEKIT